MEGLCKHVATIECRNEKGKTDKVMIPFDDLLSATRFVLTFKPKGGYTPHSWHIDKHWHLF